MTLVPGLPRLHSKTLPPFQKKNEGGKKEGREEPRDRGTEGWRDNEFKNKPSSKHKGIHLSQGDHGLINLHGSSSLEARLSLYSLQFAQSWNQTFSSVE